MIELVKNKGSLTLEKPYLKGEPGGYYVPDVSPEGELTWSPSEADLPAVEPRNIKGKNGESGVYCGSEEPQDQEVKVWIDPDGTMVDEYATIGYVDTSIDNLLTKIEGKGYQTASQVQDAINKALGAIENGDY